MLIEESFEDYRKRGGLNFSSAKPRIDGYSWAECVEIWKAEKVPTAAMRLGTMVHARAEQDDFDKKYKVIPRFSYGSTADKEDVARWAAKYGECGGTVLAEDGGIKRLAKCKKEEIEAVLYDVTSRAGITLVDQESYNCAVGAYNAIIAQPTSYSAQLWRSGVHKEQTAVWKAGELLCKGRFDNVSAQYRRVIDLKTAHDVREGEVIKSIRNRRYAYQAAHYAWGARNIGLDVEGVTFIFVKPSPPFPIQVVDITLDALEPYYEVLLRVYDEYHHCQENDMWPSYGNKILTMQAEEWELRV